MRLLLICAAALPLGACHASWESGGHSVDASGTGATRTYAAVDFTAVALEGSDDVDVRYADTYSVKAEGSPKVLDLLDIRVDGTTLKIGRKPNSGWSWDNGAKISVTLPKLVSASISGSGNMAVDRAEGDFSGGVSGSGDLRIASLNGHSADLSIAGSGNLVIAGTAGSLDADTAGSGDIDAAGLTVSRAKVSVAGSGNVKGTVKGDAQVSIVGSGDVDLGGGAKCSVSSLGSGDAHCS